MWSNGSRALLTCRSGINENKMHTKYSGFTVSKSRPRTPTQSSLELKLHSKTTESFLSAMDCGQPQTRAHVGVSAPRTTLGSTAQYSCDNSKHLLIGDSTTQCMATCVPDPSGRACSSSNPYWSVRSADLPHCRCKSV